MTRPRGTTGSRTGKWREKWAGRVCTPSDMVGFLDEVGCCTGKALPGYPDFPCQSEVLGAIGAGTPDPWWWKDDLHIEKRLYYTRVFGGQPGFVSLRLLPALIATNGRVVDELLLAGQLSVEAQQIYDVIEAHGPIPIRDLKRALTPDAERAASRELHGLERRFIVTKTGISGRTRGTYGYVWDLVERWMPEMLSAADRLGRTASAAIIREHMANYGIPPDSPFYLKVLGWSL